MPLNINNIKQASPKANQVATEQYVDTSIAGIDVTQDISANNDTFAQSQGFSSYSDMATKYTALKKTIISGGYINTGLVNANSIVANSISADRLVAGTNSSTVWTGGGLISQNFDGNPYGNIGSPTQGFRLSANAAGTSTDPNIYGAYIKGATLEGTALNVSDVRIKAEGYPNNFGDIFIKKMYQSTTSIISDTFIARNYSSGYNALRVCTSVGVFQIFIQANGRSSGRTAQGAYVYITISCYLDVSIDGGTTFTNLASNSNDWGYASIVYTYNYTGTATVQFRMRVSSATAATMEINLINN